MRRPQVGRARGLAARVGAKRFRGLDEWRQRAHGARLDRRSAEIGDHLRGRVERRDAGGVPGAGLEATGVGQQVEP